MAVIEVDLLQDDGPTITSVTSKVIEAELQNVAQSTTVNNVSVAAVEVISETYIANVYVGAAAPTAPFENQVWIDIS